jgi:hypothetical protein
LQQARDFNKTILLGPLQILICPLCHCNKIFKYSKDCNKDYCVCASCGLELTFMKNTVGKLTNNGECEDLELLSKMQKNRIQNKSDKGEVKE